MYAWLFPVIWGFLRILSNIMAAAGLALLAAFTGIVAYRMTEYLLEVSENEDQHRQAEEDHPVQPGI